MVDEQDAPLAGLASVGPLDVRAPRVWNVITVPEGKVGKPRKKPKPPKGGKEFLDVQILPTNWITYATCKGDQPITVLESTWQVPQPPVQNNGQLLFIFNGLQNASASQIIQPILQWGVDPSWGGGPSWYAMPLFVNADAGDVLVPSAGLTPVAPGANLTGYVRMVGQAAGSFTYECGFVGVPQPPLSVQTDMMVEAVEVLEAYGIVQAANYPAQAVTTFSAATMTVAGAPVHPAWAKVDRITNYNQHTVPWPDGHVDIHYGAA
jgi:hypothetical protein